MDVCAHFHSSMGWHYLTKSARGGDNRNIKLLKLKNMEKKEKFEPGAKDLIAGEKRMSSTEALASEAREFLSKHKVENLVANISEGQFVGVTGKIDGHVIHLDIDGKGTIDGSVVPGQSLERSEKLAKILRTVSKQKELEELSGSWISMEAEEQKINDALDQMLS